MSPNFLPPTTTAAAPSGTFGQSLQGLSLSHHHSSVGGGGGGGGGGGSSGGYANGSNNGNGSPPVGLDITMNNGSGAGSTVGVGSGHAFSFTSPTTPHCKDVLNNVTTTSSNSSDASNSSQPTNGWSFEEQYKQVRQLYDISNDPKRKEFLDDLFAFMQKRGTPISRLPIMAKSVLDLYELYNLVIARGGLVDVINKKLWQEIIKGLHLPSSITSAAFTLRTQYMKYLYPYECDRQSLSTPGELQAAIDGNRREGRRASFGQYENLAPQQLQMNPLQMAMGSQAALLAASHQQMFNTGLARNNAAFQQELDRYMQQLMQQNPAHLAAEVQRRLHAQAQAQAQAHAEAQAQTPAAIQKVLSQALLRQMQQGLSNGDSEAQTDEVLNLSEQAKRPIKRERHDSTEDAESYEQPNGHNYRAMSENFIDNYGLKRLSSPHDSSQKSRSPSTGGADAQSDEDYKQYKRIDEALRAQPLSYLNGQLNLSLNQQNQANAQEQQAAHEQQQQQQQHQLNLNKSVDSAIEKSPLFSDSDNSNKRRQSSESPAGSAKRARSSSDCHSAHASCSDGRQTPSTAAAAGCASALNIMNLFDSLQRLNFQLVKQEVGDGFSISLDIDGVNYSGVIRPGGQSNVEAQQ